MYKRYKQNSESLSNFRDIRHKQTLNRLKKITHNRPENVKCNDTILSKKERISLIDFFIRNVIPYKIQYDYITFPLKIKVYHIFMDYEEDRKKTVLGTGIQIMESPPDALPFDYWQNTLTPLIYKRLENEEDIKYWNSILKNMLLKKVFKNDGL